jgi:hypothetical protein
MREIRKKKLQSRKNFFPTLIVIAFLWATLALIVFFIEPNVSWAIPVFFILVFLALLFSLSMLFGNSRMGLVAAASIGFFILLAYFGQGNILNLLLIAGLAVTIELLFSKKS